MKKLRFYALIVSATLLAILTACGGGAGSPDPADPGPVIPPLTNGALGTGAWTLTAQLYDQPTGNIFVDGLNYEPVTVGGTVKATIENSSTQIGTGGTVNNGVFSITINTASVTDAMLSTDAPLSDGFTTAQKSNPQAKFGKLELSFSSTGNDPFKTIHNGKYSDLTGTNMSNYSAKREQIDYYYADRYVTVIYTGCTIPVAEGDLSENNKTTITPNTTLTFKTGWNAVYMQYIETWPTWDGKAFRVGNTTLYWYHD